jgi:hypothetical protein
MSKIEESAKDYLTPLILGNICQIDVFGQKLVAIWIALKALTIEHNSKENVITPQTTRDDFRLHRKIPSAMQIFVAACASKDWNMGLLWETHTVAISDSLDVSQLQRPAGPNIQAITFGLGKLLVHLLHTTAPGFDPEMQTNIQNVVHRIYPVTTPIIKWPPRRALSFDEANYLARTINRMSAGSDRVNWIE